MSLAGEVGAALVRVRPLSFADSGERFDERAINPQAVFVLGQIRAPAREGENRHGGDA